MPRSDKENPNYQKDDYYKKYYGKYRGKVLDNIDPDDLGRIIAYVPNVPGSKTNFAMPCVPYAGPGVGLYTLPPIDANVWIEYEGGDPNFPIWSGCFWGPDEIPLIEFADPFTKIFKTDFITMILNDTPDKGGFTLECYPEAVGNLLTMLFNSEGITIICPESKITMTKASITSTVPESIISITPENIKATVPESIVTMTAENISAEIPPTSVNMTGETITVETPEIDVTAEASIEVESPTTSITGSVEIEGAVSIEGETNVVGALTVEGETNITPECTIEGDQNVTGAVTIEGDEAVAGAIEGIVVPPI